MYLELQPDLLVGQRHVHVTALRYRVQRAVRGRQVRAAWRTTEAEFIIIIIIIKIL